MDSLEWERNYVAEYRALATFLMDYGVVVSPELMGSVWQELLALRERVSKRPPASDAEREGLEREIDLILVVHASSPAYRAQLVYRALLQPPLQVCSHMIELATFHYYKGDYLSCVMLLIPAAEAMLRKYVGVQGDVARPIKAANERLRKAPAEFEGYSDRRSAYAESVAQFNDRWLWKDTRAPDADFRLSHLNRHHALHGLGPQNVLSSPRLSPPVPLLRNVLRGVGP